MCSLGGRIWREWKETDGFRRTLSKAQRKSYIEAVKCMKSTPPLHDMTENPAVKNHYDDFLAVHVMQTGSIHNTVSHLPPPASHPPVPTDND